MILHPAVLALFVSSLLIGLMVLYAALHAVRIILQWDMKSGSELQLRLEKNTYLISTLLAYAFGFQLLSFFLYIFTADTLHGLFVGAMCAAGTLQVNGYGYPTLMLKLLNFLLAGLWLIVNYTDNRAYDYPLIRKKYVFLLALVPFLVTEMAVQGLYLSGLRADIITSCCGSLFSAGGQGITSDLAALPPLPMEIAFYASMGVSLFLGLRFLRKGSGGYLFSLSAGAAFFVAIVSLISFISLYFYEMPTHHCPFDILQEEYGFIGYPLYLSLLAGGVAGMGVGLIMPFR
ncbi:MAG: hypothetical protein IT388_01650, partial [Nitrospirales bacterium]|nr:hypothetical protein [Nitrospirales bacterium]